MGGEEEEEDRGISVIVGGAGEECVREGREWGKQMVFHFHGGGRTGAQTPGWSQLGGGGPCFRRKKHEGMDAAAMWQKVGIPDLGLLISL